MIQIKEELVAGLHEISVECTTYQRDMLLKHLSLVIEKSRDVNLTRIDSIDDGIYLHCIDSLLCVPHLRSMGRNLEILDLGTGGGFPGIPLAIVLDAHVVLIDSITKKIAAVDTFIKQLDLEKRCCACAIRSEDLARQRPASFDVVVARAVAQTNVLVELASPLLKQGGVLCALKAKVSEDEVDAASKAAKLCGMGIVSRETIDLPHEHGHRELIYIEKNGEPSVKLPRRNGMASKRPLGV